MKSTRILAGLLGSTMFATVAFAAAGDASLATAAKQGDRTAVQSALKNMSKQQVLSQGSSALVWAATRDENPCPSRRRTWYSLSVSRSCGSTTPAPLDSSDSNLTRRGVTNRPPSRSVLAARHSRSARQSSVTKPRAPARTAWRPTCSSPWVETARTGTAGQCLARCWTNRRLPSSPEDLTASGVVKGRIPEAPVGRGFIIAAKLEAVKSIELAKRKIREDTAFLNAKASRYKNLYGDYPRSTDELRHFIELETTADFPAHPLGGEYIYDPKTGKVESSIAIE